MKNKQEKWDNADAEELFRAVLKLKNTDEAKRFFRDLLTEPEILDFIHPNENIDMDNLISRAMKRWKVSVYPMCGGWFDLGHWKEYQDSVYRIEHNENK